MRRPTFDQHLDAALVFAASHAPCLVVVDTLTAYNNAIIRLSQLGHVYRLNAGMAAPVRNDSIRAFDTDEDEGSDAKRFLVATRPIIYYGGYRFERPAYITTSSEVSEDVARQIRGRFVFVKGQFTEHLIHTKPCPSSRQF